MSPDGETTLGIVGGGQLGRMLGEAASPLGVEVIVVDPTPNPPAAPVASDWITAEFDDEAAFRKLANRVDCLTYEIELVDPDALQVAAETADIPVHPAPESLRITQDKLLEKRTLDEAGIPVPDYRAVDSQADLRDAFEELGRPLMLKARQGGYDGRGNAPVETVDDAIDAFGNCQGLIAESFVDFDRELSVMGVAGRSETGTFPTVENIHREEILRQTVAPARTADSVRDRAGGIATDILELLPGRGVFGIELFEVDGTVLVNEIAPRPHNSGHYTIEAAVTSQFDAHIRAVLGWPLGSTALRDVAVMANLLGSVDESQPVNLSGTERILETPGAALHWYGKREVYQLRKMGHVTCIPPAGPDHESLLPLARELATQVHYC